MSPREGSLVLTQEVWWFLGEQVDARPVSIHLIIRSSVITKPPRRVIHSVIILKRISIQFAVQKGYLRNGAFQAGLYRLLIQHIKSQAGPAFHKNCSALRSINCMIIVMANHYRFARPKTIRPAFDF